jgi:hypothetical protein
VDALQSVPLEFVGYDLPVALFDRYVLPDNPLWYAGPNAISNTISFAKFNSGSHDAMIRVYDDAGNVIETDEETGEFKEW